MLYKGIILSDNSQHYFTHSASCNGRQPSVGDQAL